MVHLIKNNRIQQFALKMPDIKVISPSEFDKRFKNKWSKNMWGYGLTLIFKNGKVKVYISDTGDKHENDKIISHEIKELGIWKGLTKSGISPEKATKMAHLLNHVKCAEHERPPSRIWKLIKYA